MTIAKLQADCKQAWKEVRNWHGAHFHDVEDAVQVQFKYKEAILRILKPAFPYQGVLVGLENSQKWNGTKVDCKWLHDRKKWQAITPGGIALLVKDENLLQFDPFDYDWMKDFWPDDEIPLSSICESMKESSD